MSKMSRNNRKRYQPNSLQSNPLVSQREAQLQVENAGLRRALESVEWIRDHDKSPRFWMCPWCHMMRFQGHAATCPRQLALALPGQSTCPEFLDWSAGADPICPGCEQAGSCPEKQQADLIVAGQLLEKMRQAGDAVAIIAVPTGRDDDDAHDGCYEAKVYQHLADKSGFGEYIFVSGDSLAQAIHTLHKAWEQAEKGAVANE